jgi:hypothetical protein
MMCEWPDGKLAPCWSRAGEGNPVMSYCSWTSRSEQLVIFDAQSFEAVLSIKATAQPRGDGDTEPTSLITADFQPTTAIVRVCGTTREVPYDLSATPARQAAP